jgi:hypothetical protein
MSTTDRSFPSTSHVFRLPPTAAASVFDVMILDPAVATDLIPAGPLRRNEPSGYHPLRVLRATLRLPGRLHRTVDVVLELLPWSDERTELAIWTTARPRLPMERTVSAYVWSAQHALATLAELIVTGQPVAPHRGPWLADPLDEFIPISGVPEPRTAGHRRAEPWDPPVAPKN